MPEQVPAKFRGFKMAALFQDRQIQNQIANRNADARFAVARLENPKWKILNWEMRFGRDFNKTFLPAIHRFRAFPVRKIRARANPPAARRNCSCQTKSQIFDAL